MKNMLKVGGALALILFLGVSLTHARTQYPPASLLAAKWWIWALETTAAESPLLDTTGELNELRQSGGIWFLAGNFGGATVRTVRVPVGKALFFPVANYFAGGFLPAPKKGGYDPGPVEYARKLCSEGLAGITSMTCEVDGVNKLPEAIWEQSQPFGMLLPADSLFGPDAQVCAPTVDEGYYMLLSPLTPGTHVIHFTARAGTEPDAWVLDVTYNIIVGSPAD